METPPPDLDRASKASDLPEALRDLDRDDLSRLVREVHDAEAISYQRMADRATAAGVTVSKPYLQRLATNGVTSAPGPDMLRAIAVATRRPLSVVQRAAAIQFLDYRATELSGYDDDVRVIVAHLAGMDRTKLRQWRRMIEAAEDAPDE